jgi:hypothetical protein
MKLLKNLKGGKMITSPGKPKTSDTTIHWDTEHTFAYTVGIASCLAAISSQTKSHKAGLFILTSMISAGSVALAEEILVEPEKIPQEAEQYFNSSAGEATEVYGRNPTFNEDIYGI